MTNTRYRAAEATKAARLRALYQLQVSRFPDYGHLYQAYLDVGLRLLGMELGIVSRVEDERYTVQAAIPRDSGVNVGDVFAIADTYCARVVERNSAVVMDHVSAMPDMAGHPVYVAMGLESYIGAPIHVNGRIFGTLNFTARLPRETPFSQIDREFVLLMAQGLGHVIEHDQLEQERNHALAELHKTHALFESGFHHAPIGMTLVGRDGRLLRVNHAMCALFGYTEEELLRLDFQSVTHPEDLQADLDLLNETLAGKRRSYRLEKRYFHRDGSTIWALLSVALIRDDGGEPDFFISQILDITEHKRNQLAIEEQRQALEVANAQLAESARTDSLTDLPNRRSFEEHLAQACALCRRSRRPLSLALIDVDHFKSYNDQFGHPAGDEALREVAAVMATALRDSDVLARYGGEEFVAILPETDADAAFVACERVRAAVTSITGLRRPMSVSVGYATLTPDTASRQAGVTENELIAAADGALYQAKNEGRNRVLAATGQTGSH